MNIKLVALGLIPALTLAAASANATQTIALGTPKIAPSLAYFLVQNEKLDLTLIDSNFADTVYGANTSFDDVFTFTSTLAGSASGSVSVSPAGLEGQITISTFAFNKQSVSVADAALGHDLFTITSGVMNTIEITGITGVQTVFGSFGGTANFQASAVPEPATWVSVLVGFGFMGFALRRRLQSRGKTT